MHQSPLKKSPDFQALLGPLLMTAAIILTLNMVVNHYALQVLLPLLKALYLGAVSVLYGLLILQLTHPKNPLPESGPPTAPLPTAFALGLMFTTLVFYLLSFFKLVSPVTITIYLTAPLPVLLNTLKKQKPGFTRFLRDFFRRPGVEYLLFLFPLVYAALPPTFYDSLAYHLGIPNLYLQNSGFIPTPHLVYANTFVYYEVSLIPAVFAGDMVPRLFHFLLGMVFLLAVTDVARRRFNLKKPALLLVIILSMPMTPFLLTAVKNDLASGFFIFLGITCFLDDRKSLSALFWGFSLGIKYSNIVPLFLFLLLWAASETIRHRRIEFKKLINVATLFGIIALAVLLPALTKNYIFTGNPVFPFFHGYFQDHFQGGSPKVLDQWDDSRMAILQKDTKKLFHSFSDLLKFPLTLSFGEPGSGGNVGPLFLMFLPFMLVPAVRKKVRKKITPSPSPVPLFLPVPLLLFALLTLVVGGNFKMSVRVWYISFIVLSLYVAVLCAVLFEKTEVKETESAVNPWSRIAGPIMRGLLFVVLGFNLLGGFSLQERLYASYSLLSGKTGTDPYRQTRFPTWKGMDFINRKAPPRARVLVVGDARGYYLKRPYRISTAYDYSILKPYLAVSKNPGDFRSALRADGIDLVLLNIAEYHRLQQGYKRLEEEDFKRSLDYLKQLPMVFREGEVFVFRVT